VLPDGSPAAKEIMEVICSARRERTFTPGIASMDQALEAGIDIISNPLKGPLLPRKMAQCSLLALDAFCSLGMKRSALAEH
jgi:hypothetical protein